MPLKMYEANKLIGTLPIELRRMVMNNRDNELSAATGNFELDIIKFDAELDLNDPDYDCLECTYKDKKDISIGDYIEIKYGKDVYNKIYRLI